MNNHYVGIEWSHAPLWASMLIKTRSGRIIFSNGDYFIGSSGEAIKHGSVIDILPCGYEIISFKYEDCTVLSSRNINEKVGDL